MTVLQVNKTSFHLDFMCELYGDMKLLTSGRSSTCWHCSQVLAHWLQSANKQALVFMNALAQTLPVVSADPRASE